MDNGALVYNVNGSTTLSLPSGAGISGSGNLTATAKDLQFNGSIGLSGSQSYIQSGASSLYEGLESVAASTTLSGSAISLTGDLGKRNSTGNTVTLSTSAANGPINLNISLGRGGIWYPLTSFAVNAGTGAINVTGAYAANGWNNAVALTGAVNITGNVNSTGGGAVTINSTAPGSISGILSGGISLTQQGPSTLTLNNANTYTGGTTISGGTLQLTGGNNRLATTGAITATGGLWDLGGGSQATSAAVTFQGGTVQDGTINATSTAYAGQSGLVTANLAGAAGLNKTTVGTLTLAGSNYYGGTTAISGGAGGCDHRQPAQRRNQRQ